MKHPLREVIIYTPEQKAAFWLAFYQSRKLQARCSNDKWTDIASGYSLDIFIIERHEVRIAPEPITCVPYRRYIEKYGDSYLPNILVNLPCQSSPEDVQGDLYFSKWLDDDWVIETIEVSK